MPIEFATKFDLKAPKPGAYVTTRDHRLPKPDKRLRGGWLSTEGVPAGTVVIVTVRSLRDADVAAWRRECTEVTLQLPGGYSIPGKAELLVAPDGKVAVGLDEAAGALAKEVADDLLEYHEGTCILDWIEAGSNAQRWEAVLSTLLRAGRVSEADIRTAMKINDVEDDRRFDAEAYVRGWRHADEGVQIAEIGEKVRGYQGGGEDTITAASAGALAQNVHANRFEGKADDAHVKAQARIWAEQRHPLPEFGAPASDAESMLAQIRALLAK